MDLGLRGKKAILSGATAGTGRAVADLLASEGVDIGFCGAAANVGATLSALKAAGGTVIGGVDVRDGEKFKRWLEQTVAALGGCDIFIVNTALDAGLDLDHSWPGDFETEVLHTVRGCETLMPHLKSAGGGAIVIIGASATDADPALAAYSAMQAGLVTYSKQLSQFVGRDGTRVNLVAPSPGSGSPAEVARTVAFLASPAASLVTGAYIVPGVTR
jgi:NAD(P)-dependent dehydrogenase (short-subunit alcohol dehydrogenase family)